MSDDDSVGYSRGYCDGFHDRDAQVQALQDEIAKLREQNADLTTAYMVGYHKGVDHGIIKGRSKAKEEEGD